MAENQQKDDFEFEIEGEEREVTPVQKSAASQQTTKGKPDVDIEIQDDTPEEDRGREPLPKQIVEELEQDELEDYSDKVKTRLKQMKKVWHDERRAKDAALREQQEAIAIAQKIMEENKKLRSTLTEGEKTLLQTYKTAAELEMEMASRAYKEAHEAGDSDKALEAQKKLNEAHWKLQQVNNYRPSLQPQEFAVNSQPEEVPRQPVRLDSKTAAWQERNRWWGSDPEMTALALGYHQKLERDFGPSYVGTDEYWTNIDKTMRRRFPEYFGVSEEGEAQTSNGGGKPAGRTEAKPAATVVAPASRSTSAKRIVLKQSEVNIAKKFGLTPEQYAREKMRLENQNG